MNTDELTPEQAKRIYDALWPSLNYLARLKRRIDGQAFPLDDPLRREVEHAHAAMQALCVRLNYMAVGTKS